MLKIMSWQILLSIAEVKKKRCKNNRWIQKKTIPDYEIFESIEHKVKSKIGTIFKNQKILEEYSVQIYEIDPYFYEHYRKKIQTDKNESEYILFKMYIYFTKYSLAVEIDEKGHTNRDLIFEEKREKALEKKIIVNLLELILVEKIMMQTMKLYSRSIYQSI